MRNLAFHSLALYSILLTIGEGSEKFLICGVILEFFFSDFNNSIEYIWFEFLKILGVVNNNDFIELSECSS